MTKAPRGGLRPEHCNLGEELVDRQLKSSMRRWGFRLMLQGGRFALWVGFLLVWLSDWLN